MLLEISIPSVAGGAFQDILVAGGSFPTGGNGYNTTLSTTSGNPLAGRQCWSGLSAGTSSAPAYVTSAVNLPASANGQSIIEAARGDDTGTVAQAWRASGSTTSRLPWAPPASQRFHTNTSTYSYPIQLLLLLLRQLLRQLRPRLQHQHQHQRQLKHQPPRLLRHQPLHANANANTDTNTDQYIGHDLPVESSPWPSAKCDAHPGDASDSTSDGSATTSFISALPGTIP
jgi:hypothetical protein